MSRYSCVPFVGRILYAFSITGIVHIGVRKYKHVNYKLKN